MNTSLGKIVFVVAWAILTLAIPTTSRAQETVHGLRQNGWVVVKKSDANEWRKGIPPYENLDRLIYVVTYILEKDGKTITCTLARDMMADTFKQTCRPTK